MPFSVLSCASVRCGEDDVPAEPPSPQAASSAQATHEIHRRIRQQSSNAANDVKELIADVGGRECLHRRGRRGRRGIAGATGHLAPRRGGQDPDTRLRVNIVVLDGYTLNPGDNPWDDVARLGTLQVYDRTRPEEVVQRVRNARIALTNKTVLDADAIGALPDLRFIAVLATGYNVVDVVAARRRGIPVSNVPEYGTTATAQHTLAL